MCTTFWKNQGRFSSVKRDNPMFVIFIKYMFSCAWIAKVDMAKITIALYFSALTNFT